MTKTIKLYIPKLDERRRLANYRIDLYDGIAEDLVAKLEAGEINLQQWVRGMRTALKDLHTSTAIIAKGGEVASMTQADWGWVGAKCRWQFMYLERLALVIYQYGMPSNMVRRLQMYGDAARHTLEHFIGIDQEYPPLPYEPGDGSTRCLTSCRCRWIVRRVRDSKNRLIGWYVTWRMSIAENCEDCVRRSKEWVNVFIEA